VRAEIRQKAIVDCFEQREELSYRELAEMFNTSSMTIRRDVEELCRRGVAAKTIGGVRQVDRSSFLSESPLASRLAKQKAEKRAIARCAVGLIEPGQTIYLDGGTSSVELARRVASHCKNVTIVTNSALICMELGRSRQNSIIGIGGQYEPSNLCFVGPSTEDSARQYFVDLAFFSTKGLLAEEGTFESFEPTYRVKQIIARQCREVAVLADHTKFGERALCKVLDISQINTVVTDDRTPIEQRTALELGGRRVLVASLPGLESAFAAEGVDNAS
jgi:DeoR family transcriptional regulator, fructose operon transcriptional repressor